MPTSDLVDTSVMTSKNTLRGSAVTFATSAPAAAVIQDMRSSGTYPDGRGGHRMVHYNGDIYSYGGLRGLLLTDYLWKFNLTTNLWTRLFPTGIVSNGRYEHSLFVYNGNLYIFGGVEENGGTFPGGFVSYLLMYNISTNATTQVTTLGSTPPARQSHGYAVVNNHLYIFGGLGAGFVLLNDVYKLNLTTMTWSLVSTGTYTARTNTAATAVGTNIYMYGGDNGPLSDFLVFDTLTDTIATVVTSPTNSPGAVRYHKMFTIGIYVYVYGGTNGAGTGQNTLYRFNTSTVAWEAPHTNLLGTASGRGRGSPAAEVVGSYIYIDDGFISGPSANVFSEFWRIDPTGFPSSTVVQMPGKLTYINATTFSLNGYTFERKVRGANAEIVITTNGSVIGLSLNRLVISWP